MFWLSIKQERNKCEWTVLLSLSIFIYVNSKIDHKYYNGKFIPYFLMPLGVVMFGCLLCKNHRKFYWVSRKKSFMIIGILKSSFWIWRNFTFVCNERFQKQTFLQTLTSFLLMDTLFKGYKQVCMRFL